MKQTFRHSILLVVLALGHLFSVAAAQAPIKDLKATVILISLDGFRADYLERHSAPSLSALAKEGVRAKSMTPAFPSLTFPNHYTIATGLYPDHNGIVANNMYDRDFKTLFTMSKREEVENGRWWLGEPIWVTAEKQGQRAAAFFFPGTEAEIGGKRPSLWKPFDDKFPNFDRVDTVLSWLDRPEKERPTMITMYFSDVDHAGHDHGPDSEAVKAAIATVDACLARLVGGLKMRGIESRVNLIIVSDHGMARVDPKNVVALDDYFDAAQAEMIAWNGAMVHIFARPDKVEAIVSSLKSKSPPHVKIYKKEDLPARFHYGTSKRIGEIVVLAEEGWSMNSRDRIRPASSDGPVKYRGAHGFDNNLESMRAIFIAKGPAFKQGTVVEAFPNVDVYNVMARILGLTPAKNDGNEATLRAVLRP